ncbi:ankyrin repeat domain-containing protein [Deinococcus sp. QL22]|uniref:ankyrin repeat domain-containing protein n=1 Tax=Deinococcus sp. QL22 TaxID=2939437 RepID=UPI002017C43B|nr:ankyrin repeat domain-containing protein [Deinococcus sp. QL22]UQN05081.1 ankyrin repeat domain-containing protein [Deinococcus sp. QL22]
MTDSTALFVAIQTGDVDTVRALVQATPGLLSAASPMGVSPLLFATYYRKPEVARALTGLHAELGGPPLTVFEAAATGETACLRTLLDADAPLVNAVSPDGFTPLGLAAFFGQEAVAAELLARGANVNAVSANAMQVQPLHSAVAGNHTGLARLLLSHGADVNAVQQDGFTPLMAAAQHGNADLVEDLLAAGADAAAQTDDGRSAASIAQEEGHSALAAFLSTLLTGPFLSTPHVKPQETRNAAPAAVGNTTAMTNPKSDHDDLQPRSVDHSAGSDKPVAHEDGRPADHRTGFQTPDPKDDHQPFYTTTPADSRVSSADHSTYEPVHMQDPHEITAQFDHLATRDPAQMEHTLQTPEFAGAQSVAGLGGELLDTVAPSAGLGMNNTAALAGDSQRRSADPNPGYTPPSEQGPPHASERPGDLPQGVTEELQNEVSGDDRR